MKINLNIKINRMFSEAGDIIWILLFIMILIIKNCKNSRKYLENGLHVYISLSLLSEISYKSSAAIIDGIVDIIAH